MAARRSLYVFVKRGLILPELEAFDFPDTAEPCPQRKVTIVAPQALALLNGAFVHEQAGLFADRLHREVGDDPRRLIDRAFALALARPPAEPERLLLLGFLDDQSRRIEDRPAAGDRPDPRHEALRALCLVLFNTNEFVTVD
jgi:hypothetical protein